MHEELKRAMQRGVDAIVVKAQTIDRTAFARADHDVDAAIVELSMTIGHVAREAVSPTD